MAAKYPSQSSPARPFSDNYVKVCEAIQTMGYLGLPTIQSCVEKCHQNHQPKMQGCQSPNKCPTKKKPSKPVSCQPCIDWGKVIEAECYPPGKGIQWKNVNSTLLHKYPAEVAKGFVFIIPPGQGCTDFSDFDIGGILKLMMGFKDYHGGDQDCYDKIQKVVNIRNGLSHMKIKNQMYISDKQLDVYFNEIDECIDAIKGHQKTLKADEIKDCIKQIRQSGVTTDMIKDALTELSDGLKQALEEAKATQTDQLKKKFIKIQMQEQIKEIKCAAKEGTKEVVAAVADNTLKVSTTVADGTQVVVAAVADGTKKIVAAVADNTQKVSTTVADGTQVVVAAVADGTKEIVAAVADNTQKVSTTVADGTQEVVAVVVDNTQKVSTTVADGTQVVVAALTDNTQKVSTTVADGTKEVVAAVADNTQKVSTTVADGTQVVVAAVANNTQKVSTTVADGTQVVVEAVADNTQNVSTTVADGTQVVVAAVANNTQKVSTTVADGTQVVVAAVADNAQKISTTVADGTHVVVAAVAAGTQKNSKAVADGTQKVVDKLDIIHREIDNLSTQNTCVNQENTEHSTGTGDSGAVKAFDLKACQEELQEYYLNDLGKVNLLPWVPDEIKEMESIFVDLELARKDKSKQVQRLEKNEDLVTLGDKRILVTGDTGGGKSTVVSNIAYKWAKQDPTSPLAKFSLVFVVNIIEIQDSSASLMDLIFDQILPADSKVPKKGLQSYIRDHAENVLVLIDGIDEDRSSILKCESSEITKVMHNKMLRESSVILTSRPHKVGDLKEHQKHYTHVQLKGFSLKNICKYIANFLQDKGKTEKLIARLQEQRHILALASIPVLLVMICLLWEDQCELPQTKTQLYKRTIKYLWSRYQSKKGEDPSSDGDSDDDNFEDQLKDLLNRLGQAALKGMLPSEGEIIFDERPLNDIEVAFDEKDFGKELCELGCHLGILSKERLRSKLKLKTSVSFLHNTFQEFCIAVHLVELMVTNQSEVDHFYGFLYKFTPSELLCRDLVLAFCCGLHPSLSSAIVKHMLQMRDKLEVPKLTYLEEFVREVHHISIHLDHIFESQLSLEQCMDLVHQFPKTDTLKLRITHELIPSVLYLLKLHESSPRGTGLFSRLHTLEITTGFKTWLQTILEHTTSLTSFQMIVSKPSATLTTDIDLMFRVLSGLNIENLHLQNKVVTDRFDVTTLLKLFIEKNVKITFLKLEGFQFDINTMVRCMSTLEASLVAFGLSGSIIGPFHPGPVIIQDKLTSIPDIMKKMPTLKKLQVLEIGLFRIGSSIKYLKSVAPQLTRLAFVACDLRERHLKELFSFLKKAQKLKKLNLSGNAISLLSIGLLVEALQHIPALEELMLENTGLTDETACILATCLKEMSPLQFLNLDRNPGIGQVGRNVLGSLQLKGNPESYKTYFNQTYTVVVRI